MLIESITLVPGGKGKSNCPGEIGPLARLVRPNVGVVTTIESVHSEFFDTIADIADAMRAAGKREGHDFAVVPDRREAIAQALAMAVDEDAVLLAGKGHERTVHVGDARYECHDPTVARTALRSILAGRR